MSSGKIHPADDALEPTDEDIKEMEARRDALRDVYGTSNLKSFEEGEAMLSKARKQVNEALQMLPNEGGLREAYDEAMKKAPHLVEMESNPMYYLRHCDFDPWLVANNIAMYWTMRKEFFGDRAFLPMVGSGKGALTEEDVKAMKCGGSSILPPEGNDRYVYFTDRARYCTACTAVEVRARIAFYLLQCFMDNDEVTRSGMVIAAVIDTEDKTRVKATNTPGVKMMKIFKSGGIPINFRAFHLLVLRKRSFMETSVPLWLHVLERWKFISMRTVVHYSDSKEAAISDLKQYGFLEEHTPELLGGTYRLKEEFEKWLQTRLDIEKTRYAAISAQAAADQFCSQQPPGSLPTEASLNALEDLAAAAEKARVEEAKDRKRKLDAIYQRNKRENERSSVQRLKEQMNGLRRENAGLKAEHESLQLSIERALLALEDHKKGQQQVQLEGIIHSAAVPPRRHVPPMPPPVQQVPHPGNSIPSSVQHIPLSGNNNNNNNNGGFFSNIFRSLPNTGGASGVQVQVVAPPSMNNPIASQNLALLQRLQASGSVRGPTSSQLAQQIQLQQQQMLLQQQLQQQHLMQRQAELVLLGVNNPGFNNNNLSGTALPTASSVPGNFLHQQHRQLPETEKDILESILRRQLG